jgi:hypothetical protein
LKFIDKPVFLGIRPGVQLIPQTSKTSKGLEMKTDWFDKGN